MNEQIKNNKEKWYIINTYTGHEDKVKEYIQMIVRTKNLGDKIREVLIPKKEIVALKKGKRSIVEKEFFPGYILVNMVLDDEVYWMIKNITGVTDFLGGENPIPLQDSEFEKIQDMIKKKEEQEAKPEISFKEGDRVRIIDGPFDNFMGVVEDSDDSKQKVKIMVTIFGRTTPVELDFLQVEKI
ncbi:MAG: transcription termination/antitermination factor NusG [Elusimicrobia bacterium]|nr:transcription termination/antitermination factor NusG [Elusimicrobiota bacterium]